MHPGILLIADIGFLTLTGIRNYKCSKDSLSLAVRGCLKSKFIKACAKFNLEHKKLSVLGAFFTPFVVEKLTTEITKKAR